MHDLAPDILGHLTTLYGELVGQTTLDRLGALLNRYTQHPSRPFKRGEVVGGEISERDVILITYGDQLREPGVPSLRTLANFCKKHLAGLVTCIHILPFFPYSSDDGFSVVDYREVDPALGGWSDVARLDRNFRLMFDAVINHISAQSQWFRAFLRDDPAYRDYFFVVEGNPDLSQVVRPRAHPLLTKFTTPSGEKKVWTTFSADQVDLNYANPDVLLEIVDILLFYVSHGAEFIRLDAIAYLWKEIGTPCIHLPETHRIIQLVGAVLDEVAPHVLLITETNVPHAENVSYFGDGTNEAQLVYNFALPPLTLHALQSGDARVLSEWASGLHLPSDRVTFFNFLASHDGVGLNPARGLLGGVEIQALVERTLAQGGRISYKQNSDGTQSPYELNINYFDALGDPYADESLDAQVDRFIAAHAIMLSLVGLPGIYFPSLVGSRGWPEGVAQTGRHRTINRQKLARAELERELAAPGSVRNRVFQRLAHLLRVRAAHPAFHPHGRQQVIDWGEAVFAVLRTSPAGDERVLCLHNVSGQPQWAATKFPTSGGQTAIDMIGARPVAHDRGGAVALAPYQVLWLASHV